MANKRLESIGLSYINQKEENVNRKEKYFFNKENEEFIYYFPIFSKNKRDELIVELASSINYCKENNLDYLKNDADILQYTYFLVIKHFTSLYDELKDKSFEVHIETLSKLYDTEIYDLFFKEVFDEVEVQKVIDQLYSIEDLVDKYVKALQNKKDYISNNVGTKILKDKVLN